ncbi:MAG: HPr kinase/phosphorylase [Spirochaetales bacterium]|nr:HPr kinase/phosphorylase [Spirochaetales bacterium]
MKDIVFTVLDLLDLDLKEHNELNLRCLCGRPGLSSPIREQDLNRPGLTLSGFFDGFQYNRIQVFGNGETAYVKKMIKENELGGIEKFFSYKIPCCAFTNNLMPEQTFLDIAEEAGVPVLITDLSSSEFSRRLIRALNSIFAEKQVVHATLVEVYGIGILIKGASGIGKSETALELIERGHRLIADDAVELSCVNGNLIIGRGVNDIAGHHMEIRGLGIINISHLFGVGSIRDSKQVQLVVELEEWDSAKVYDRLGSNTTNVEYLGVGIPVVTLPIKPGRNIPIIIETAAMNERLKKLGYYSAKEFNQNVLKWLEGQNARAAYYDNNKLR